MSTTDNIEKLLINVYKKELATKQELKDILLAVKKVLGELKTELQTEYKGHIASIGQNITKLDNATEQKIVNSRQETKRDIQAVERLIRDIDKRITAESVVNKEYAERLVRNVPQFDSSNIEQQLHTIRTQLTDIRTDTPDEIRNKLEQLEGSERLGIEAIDGLEDVLQTIRSQQGGTTSGGGMHRSNITDIDISSQLNGSDKTFNIQAVYNIISVDLSSFPYGSLRKGTDYTWTPTSITFTDEIAAATQLASGQRCIITAVTS